MPEGPTLVILRELTQSFAGKSIRKATGNAKIDKTRLVGQRIVALRTWGKHFSIEMRGFAVRIHFLMFGRWCIDERKDIAPRLSLAFANRRELNFYNCAVRYIEGDLDDEYDSRTDVMSDAWDPALARRKLRRKPAERLRVLVDQARQYSFEFLEWKKKFVLRQHWLVHNKGVCPQCNGRLTRAYLGTRQRRTFFCERCQKRLRRSRLAARK